MAKKSSLKIKDVDCIGVPKTTFYTAIILIFSAYIGFLVNTNIRLAALENDNENNKSERKELKGNMNTMIEKLSNIEQVLVLKADRKFQN